MKKLTVNVKRDAWATIRGYVYQVDLTIQRWLDLDAESQLELERGEDVDTIQRAMRKRGIGQSRLLEQIKARDHSLTLRSTAALGALAYFHEHERTNVGLNLNYRYVTNAKIVKERRSPVSEGTPLLTLWNQFNQDGLTDRERSKALNLIRRFLKLVHKPKDLPAKVWQPFIEFIKSTDDKDFNSFVSKVEWLAHQTPTNLADQRIQETLVTKYKTPADQAQTIYSVLFLHVFKLLSRAGIKRLTTDARDSILAAPHVPEPDRALLANLSIYLTNLTDRVEALEEAVSALQPPALPTESEIRDACRKITTRLSATIIDGQRTIVRENLRDTFNEFLASNERYLVVLGPSGAGKSICAATEVEQMQNASATVLFVRGKYFSLDQAAELIAHEMWPPITGLNWQKIIDILNANSSIAATHFVLFIEGIDEADDLHELSLQLSKLHDSIGSISSKKIKTILSCRDIAWGRFSQQRLMPLYEEPKLPQAISKSLSGGGYAYSIIRITDFSTVELDRALHEIGATELINPGRFGESASAHIATLRDMLKHPATFEHYSALHQSERAVSIQEITWSYLIGRRLSSALDRAGRQCGKNADDLRGVLEDLAIIGWQNRTKNFEFNIENVKTSVPLLVEEGKNGKISMLLALVESRILNQSVSANQTTISFYNSDIGAYLLSFELERQLTRRKPRQVRECFDQWIRESWDFLPLLDALLALLDRLAVEPQRSATLAMVEALVESNRFHHRSLFELMRPEVLRTIFEVVKRIDEMHFYDYRDAALGIRPSPSALNEIRSHLRHENPLVRQLAAQLAGAHQDQMAVEQLIPLLQDPDEDVRDKAYGAFAYIGRPAISPLIKVITDPTQAHELRRSCITALRNVGIRTNEVSIALKKTLKQSQAQSPSLLYSLFLTAAGLRDRGHANVAKNTLQHDDNDVVLTAAKYLAEVPEPRIFSALREALKPKISEDGLPKKRSWEFNQLIFALWMTNKVKAAPVVLNLIQESLQNNNSELVPFSAIHLVEKVDLARIPPLILKHLIEKLQKSPEERLTRECARVLGATWRTDHLKALVAANEKFAAQGVDVARLLVDAIIPEIPKSEGLPLPETFIKCKAANFVPEAIRLFNNAGALSCMELSNLLWVCGDSRAEAVLIHRFENPSHEREAAHERPSLARALGTCSNTAGVQVVLNYLRTKGEELPLHFHQTTLYPLLVNNPSIVRELREVARDSTLNWGSRATTLLALSLWDATTLEDLVTDIAETSSDQPRLQGQAVRLLALLKDQTVLSRLHDFLNNSEHSNVKAEAAEALAWLDDSSSVSAIERAFEESPAPGLAFALAHFRQETSVPILLEHLDAAPLEWKPIYLETIGAFWRYPKGRAAILEQFDRWSSPEERFLNSQAALISGLLKYEPDIILDQFNKSFNDGSVTTTARERMAREVANLLYRKYQNESLLLETFKLLLSDKHVPARERAGHALRYADPSFCHRLYTAMHDSSVTEWERASAVYSLGFWDSPIARIEAARYDEELLVRRTADAALAMCLKNPHLERHFHRYNTLSGLARLSSYLCLAEQGDQSTIWTLNDNKNTKPFARIFRRSLCNRIERRLADEYKKKSDAESKLVDSRGTITFD